MLFRFVKNKKTINVGYSEDEQQRCLVWFDNEKMHTIWQKKEERIESALTEVLNNKNKIQLIRVLEFPYVLQIHQVLMQMSTEQTYNNVIKIIQKQIPLPIDEVLFDFIAEPIEDNDYQQLFIFVVRKEVIDNLQLPKNIILDHEILCFIRGYNFLARKRLEFHNCYEFKNRILKFNNSNSLNTTQNKEIMLTLEQLNLQDIKDPNLFVCAVGAALWN